jgi:hypothetical protein
MFAKKVAFFMWGVVLVSIYWVTSITVPGTESRAFFCFVSTLVTLASIIGWAFNGAAHWDDK